MQHKTEKADKNMERKTERYFITKEVCINLYVCTAVKISKAGFAYARFSGIPPYTACSWSFASTTNL